MPTKKKVRTGKPTKSFEDFLDLTPIPDNTTSAFTRSQGRRTGMGVRLYIWNLFVANERLPKTRKMTNPMIERNVRDEYSDRAALQQSLDQRKQSVNWWRHLFNTNRLISVKRAPVISLRYDLHGDVVDTRTGNHTLSESQIHDLCLKYGIEDQRYT